MIAAERLAFVALATLAIVGCDRADDAASRRVAPTAAAVQPTTPNPSPSASPAASLARYVGAYPFDPVEGVAFLDNPLVTGAVARLVGDPAVRRVVLAGDGPGTPVARQDGMLLAWGCETHNCGAHNWTILIAPNGGSARVCYHDAATMQDRTRWYLAPGRTEMRDAPCPSEQRD